MRSSILLPAICLAFLTTSTSAIRAVPAQSCAGVCGDFTQTTQNDIVCSNSDMDTTSTGQALKKCLNCQMNSTSADPNTGETDTRWLLYNARYTLSSCLWSSPNTSYSLQASPCLTNPACGLYQDSMEYDNLSSSAGAYDYCNSFNSLSSSQQPKCQSCLQQLSDDSYLANFFIVLVAGCQQKPNPGTPLSLQGATLFSTTALNITAPQPSSSGYITPNHVSGPLNLAAIVGIAMGGIAILLIIGGCTIICCGKRRRRAKLAEREKRHAEYTGFGTKAPLGGHSEPKWGATLTPGGASSMANDNSPVSAGGSIYVSQYNSPVSTRDMISMKQAYDWKSPYAISMNKPNVAPSPGGFSIAGSRRPPSMVAPSPGGFSITGSKKPPSMTVPSPGGFNVITTRMGLKERDPGEAIEMEKLRDLRRAERKMRDEQVYQEFVREAAERGFTTSPIGGPIIITSPTPTSGPYGKS